LLMIMNTMSQRQRSSSSSKEVSQELNWDETEDPYCVAQPRW
jgi:hypothetical protein